MTTEFLEPLSRPLGVKRGNYHPEGRGSLYETGPSLSIYSHRVSKTHVEISGQQTGQLCSSGLGLGKQLVIWGQVGHGATPVGEGAVLGRGLEHHTPPAMERREYMVY